MEIRKPVVAGQFYPAQPDTCLKQIRQCLNETPINQPLPETIVAGIVPHAGWAFSGPLAAMVFSAIKNRHKTVHTFVIFGTSHSYFGPPAVYDKGIWSTPIGDIDVDSDLAKTVLNATQAVSDPKAHNHEHSIEVQLPFIKHLFPDSKILPILTPPGDRVIKLGTEIGRIVSTDKTAKIICIGSTDLTHYGPHYGFEPVGIGPEAFKWSAEVNDGEFIDLALKLEPEKLLKNAARNNSACGPGAVAATVAVAKQLGKTKGTLLAQTNSNEIMLKKTGTTSQDSVGYAAIIY